MYFGGQREQHLALAQFVYNNSYHLGIEIAPFQILCARSSQSTIGWFKTLEVRPHGTDFLCESLDKVWVIQYRLQADLSSQKSYVERRLHTLKFDIMDTVLLHVSPMKDEMRFGKRGNLNPSNIGPFEIL